ncbi:MAG: GAF domain-containing protein [Salinibacter sp.]|uniref:GAF domain-containing protein n=1 Tax=Salinibacter sp. TaxID=2065818 RepID=UPI0035D44ADD
MPVSDPTAASAGKVEVYTDVRTRIDALLDGQTDWIAAMATVACELHHSFEHYDWTGFYRAVSDDELLVGPYQGPHGCLQIDVDRGVCGAAARTRETQLWPDVSEAPDHIACQSSTQSEIVVPVLTPDDDLLAVLDVDSDALGAFDTTDQTHLEALCRDLGMRFGDTGLR